MRTAAAADTSATTRSRAAVRQTACVGFLAIGLIASAPGPALPGIRESFHLTLGEAGLLQVTSGIGYLVAVFVAGIVSDRIGGRTVLLAGVATLVAGIATFIGTDSWHVTVAASALAGAGLGAVDGPINALVNEHGGAERGADLNLTHGFFGIGAIGGPLIGGWLLAAGLGWRSVYVAGGLATLATGWLVWRLRVRPASRGPTVHIGPPSLKVLLTPVFALLAFVLCLYVGVEISIGNWAFTHLKATFASGDAIAGAATALYWGGITAGRFVMGTVGARFSPHQMIVANAIVAAIALAGTLAAPTLPLAVAGLALVGLALANIFPAVIAVAGAAYPHAVGTVTGALIATGGLGAALFPWLTGVVADRSGLGVALAGGVALLALVLLGELALLRVLRTGAVLPSVEGA